MTWHRLSVRMVWLDLARLAASTVPGYAGIVWLGDDGPVWPLVAASVFGVLGALGDLVRYRTTTFRVTGSVVEMRSGWLARKHRSVARELVRTVDVTAKLWHRPLRLRVVHVSSGEADSSFQLDALTVEQAESLRHELLPKAARPAAATGTDGQAGEVTAGEVTAASGAGPVVDAGWGEVALARFRLGWIALNSFALWSPLVVVGPLFSVYWFLRQFGVDLVGLLPPAVWVAVLVPLGFAGTALTYVLKDWQYELVRSDSVLISRRRLLDVRTVQLDEGRIRGLALTEPLLWWWLRLAQLKLVTTGAEGGVLPSGRIRRAEALDLATRLLPDGDGPRAARHEPDGDEPAPAPRDPDGGESNHGGPIAASLHRHPRGALTRRLSWALTAPLPAVAALAVWAPGRWWVAPLALTPVLAVLALTAYRSLGHGLSGHFLVVRRGALNRRTVALQRRAVIGWTFRQSLWQRRGGRIDVTVATAAGDKHYLAPDLGTEQAVAFARGATPALIEPFLVGNTNVGTGR